MNWLRVLWFWLVLLLIFASCTIAKTSEESIAYYPQRPCFLSWYESAKKKISEVNIDSVSHSYQELKMAFDKLPMLYLAVMMDCCPDEIYCKGWDEMFFTFHFNSGEQIFAAYTFVLVKGDDCKVISYWDTTNSFKITYTKKSKVLPFLLETPPADFVFESFFLFSSFDKQGVLVDMELKSLTEKLYDFFYFYPLNSGYRCIKKVYDVP